MLSLSLALLLMPPMPPRCLWDLRDNDKRHHTLEVLPGPSGTSLVPHKCWVQVWEEVKARGLGGQVPRL